MSQTAVNDPEMFGSQGSYEYGEFFTAFNPPIAFFKALDGLNAEEIAPKTGRPGKNIRKNGSPPLRKACPRPGSEKKPFWPKHANIPLTTRATSGLIKPTRPIRWRPPAFPSV